MTKHETGIIFTNDNCIGCNTCISGCPVLGANIATIENGKNRIIVDNDMCIRCGNCLNVCEHNAREYLDDTSAFLLDLQKGDNISLIVSPAFFSNFQDKAYNILGYLKHLGINKIYNSSYGSDICSWVYCNFLSENPNFKGISQSCSAVINYIEKYKPDLLEYLVPIHSPLICLAIYLRKYLNLNDSIAFLSPCIAVEDEIISESTDNLVQYNVTLSHLSRKLKNIDLSQYYAEPESMEDGFGSMHEVPGFLKETLEYFINFNGAIIDTFSVKNLYKEYSTIPSLLSKGKYNTLFDVRQCYSGCTLGTGTSKKPENMVHSVNNFMELKRSYEEKTNKKVLYSRLLPRTERLNLLNEKYKNLDYHLFLRTFKENYKQPNLLSEDVYDQIFEQLHKKTPESRNINCQSCGYSSCRKMAYAIANGFNELSNCIRYKTEENFLLYTTDKITGCPNIYVAQNDMKELIKTGKIIDFEFLQFKIKEFNLFSNILGYNGTDNLQKELTFQAEKYLNKNEKIYFLSTNSFLVKLSKENHKEFLKNISQLSLPSLIIEKEEKMHYTLISALYTPDGTEFRPETIEKKLLTAFTIAEQNNSSDVVYYNEKISQKVLKNMMISQEIPSALDKDQFYVLFQPKVSIKDTCLAGAEALIRWNKDNTIISPGDFIPVCESTGQVCKLDFFVLNYVCSKLHDWIKKGLKPVKISVNFSKLHFTQTNVVEKICQVVDFWEIPHEYIEIEFTETMYHESQKTLRDTINLLKEKGFFSSIDDFGSGYSSLSLLQNMPFDVLKIDKTLIDSIHSNQKSKTVVTDIIKMAKDLQMDVVAEGVESKETVNLLKAFDCDQIQGFYFDKPLSTNDFENRLKAKKYHK